MKTITVNLNSVEKVKSFISDIQSFENDFDLVSGRFLIDAKSIMGIFALDLSKPLKLNIHSQHHGDMIAEQLKTYTC